MTDKTCRELLEEAGGAVNQIEGESRLYNEIKSFLSQPKDDKGVNKVVVNDNGKTLVFENVTQEQAAYLLLTQNKLENKGVLRWVKERPEFNEECTLVTATKYNRNDEDLKYDYSVWQIKKLDGYNDKGNPAWYFGLLNGEGEEYGSLEDLEHADFYLIIPVPEEIPSKEPVVPVKPNIKYFIEDTTTHLWTDMRADLEDMLKPLPNSSGDNWTNDPNAAWQFSSREDTEKVLNVGYDYPVGRFIVTEHEFVVPVKDEQDEVRSVSWEEYDDAINKIGQLQEQLKDAQAEIRDLNRREY